MKEFMEKMEIKNLSKLELILVFAVAFLSGFAIGTLISPKGSRSYGCNIGYNNGNNDSCKKNKIEQLKHSYVNEK